MFSLNKHHTYIRKEFLAGLTTFFTMSFIIAVNPFILNSGAGMDFGAVLAATIISSALATLYMGLYTNYPFALAPAMGINVYFAFGLIADNHSWQSGLAACFLAGIILCVFTWLGIRQIIAEAIPISLRWAAMAGTGLFLATVGFHNVELIVEDPSIVFALGNIKSPPAYLTLFGICLIAILLYWRFKGAILIGILVNWLIGLVMGLAEWKGLVAMPPSLAPTFLQLDFKPLLNFDFVFIVFTFVFLNAFGSTLTLLNLGKQGHFINSQGKIPYFHRTLYADGIGTMVGSVLGTSPLTVYSESAAGIEEGGRTGLTAVVVALLFFISLFFFPLFSSIPAFATTPALVIVGAMLLRPLKQLNYKDLTEFIPAFLTILTIPLTIDIASGLALGLFTYPLLKLFAGRYKEVSPVLWIIAILFGIKLTMYQ